MPDSSSSCSEWYSIWLWKHFYMSPIMHVMPSLLRHVNNGLDIISIIHHFVFDIYYSKQTAKHQCTCPECHKICNTGAYYNITYLSGAGWPCILLQGITSIVPSTLTSIHLLNQLTKDFKLMEKRTNTQFVVNTKVIKW